MAASGKINANLRHSNASMPTKVLGYLCFSGLGVLLLMVVLLMIVGSHAYPRTVGLYLVIPYLTYTLVLRKDELKDGCHWHAFSKGFPLFPTMRKFLELEIALPLPQELVDDEKKPDAQFIFALFPHGAYADYRMIMDGILDQALPNVAHKCRTLAATVLFRIPVVRELAMWTGCVDARRSVAESLLDRKRSFIVMPGGEAEQIRTTMGKEIVYLKNRKGFIKLALKKGVPVVPVYVFGASDLYYTSHAIFGFRMWLMKSFGVCIPLAVGYLGSLLCPLPIKTTIVLGKALHFETKEKGNPSDEELDAAHLNFMVALTQLFDEHKERLGYGGRDLQIA